MMIFFFFDTWLMKSRLKKIHSKTINLTVEKK